MSEDFLDTRRRALENAFFIEEDKRLTRRLIEADTHQAEREEIKAITGLTEPAIIDHLIALDLTGPALAALALAPLILVAWADGETGKNEHDAVMRVAAEVGLKPDSEPYRLLQDWMVQRPPPTLLSAWEAYSRHSAAKLNDEARHALHDEVMSRAHRVAEAQGGFLRMGRISSAEAAVLSHIDRVLS
jgi:hypothetical protein